MTTIRLQWKRYATEYAATCDGVAYQIQRVDLREIGIARTEWRLMIDGEWGNTYTRLADAKAAATEHAQRRHSVRAQAQRSFVTEVRSEDSSESLDAQLDAQERDTLQSTASAKAERDAKLAELLDEEAVQRCEVQSIERTISELQDARRALTTDATTARALMRQISRMLDVERVEVAELNRVRAAIAMLLPRGTSLSTL